MKVESGAALILRALCWSSVTSGIPRKALERTRSVANTVPSYLNSFISGSVVGSLQVGRTAPQLFRLGVVPLCHVTTPRPCNRDCTAWAWSRDIAGPRPVEIIEVPFFRPDPNSISLIYL